MNILGLITEYNPFHNGHLHHLEASKKMTGASHTVAVMSGNFVQRGEPALFDKWTRATMAVASGVDLVLELPTVFAVSSAEYFSFGSIDLLNRLGLVSDLAFGSESGDIDAFKEACHFLVQDTSELDSHIRQHLATGLSYPSARQLALEALIPQNKVHLSQLLTSPNNILGIEYLKALHTLNSHIRPHTIHRIASDYNATELQGEISSATAIRKHLQVHSLKSAATAQMPPKDLSDMVDMLQLIQPYIPKPAFDTMLQNTLDGLPSYPVFPDALSQMLLYRLRSISAKDLSRIHDIKEGLENRIKTQANTTSNWSDLLEGIKSKRYPLTRLQRIMIKSLLGMTDAYIGRTGQLRAEYARVLAFNDRGRELLAIMRKTAEIPVITRPGKAPLSESADAMLHFDLLATDIYALLKPEKGDKKGGQDFSQPPIYVR